MPKAKFERVSIHHNISDLIPKKPSQPRLTTLAALEKYYQFLEKIEKGEDFGIIVYVISKDGIDIFEIN